MVGSCKSTTPLFLTCNAGELWPKLYTSYDTRLYEILYYLNGKINSFISKHNIFLNLVEFYSIFILSINLAILYFLKMLVSNHFIYKRNYNDSPKIKITINGY